MIEIEDLSPCAVSTPPKSSLAPNSLPSFRVPSRSNDAPDQVPKDSSELMRQIKLLSHGGDTAGKSQRQINRLRKQELSREALERRLMSGEDYTLTDEGVRRMKLYEERIKMEAEDILATQLEALERETKKKGFRERLRREAEERKQQEKRERAEKKKAAEARRLQVVERLRIKKEKEEKRIRDAEELKIRMQEAEKRIVKEAEERLRADREAMSYEDDVSRLFEQDCKEEAERAQYRRKQKASLMDWEAAQRKKDEEEQAQQTARVAGLEEKKKKLQEMKRLQETNREASQRALVEAREESSRLAKQMRIQKKAKFVSKVMKRGQQPPEMDEKTALKPGKEDNDDAQLRTESVATEVQLSQEFSEKINSMTSETELRTLQKSLMDKKRVLRISQRKKQDDTIPDNDTEESSADTRVRIEQINAEEEAVESRIQSLIRKEEPQYEDGEEMINKPSSAVSVSPNKESTAEKRLDVFQQAEVLLRETQEVLATATASVAAGESLSPGLVRRAALLEMELTETLRQIPEEEDAVGYRQKMEVAMGSLKQEIVSRQEGQPPPRTVVTPQESKPKIENITISPYIQQQQQQPLLSTPQRSSQPPPPSPSVHFKSKNETKWRRSFSSNLLGPGTPSGTPSAAASAAAVAAAEVTTPAQKGILSEWLTAAKNNTEDAVKQRDDQTVHEGKDPAPVLDLEATKQTVIHHPNEAHFPAGSPAPEAEDVRLNVTERRKSSLLVAEPPRRGSVKLPPIQLKASPRPTFQTVDVIRVLKDVTPRGSASKLLPLNSQSEEQHVTERRVSVEKRRGSRVRKKSIKESKAAEEPSVVDEAVTAAVAVESSPRVPHEKNESVAVAVAVSETDVKESSAETPVKQADVTQKMTTAQTTSVSDEVKGGSSLRASFSLEAAHVSKSVLMETVSKEQGQEETLTEGKTDGEEESVCLVDVDADDEEELAEEDLERLPGWNECLHTTMSSAAHHAAFYGYTAVLEALSRYFDVFVQDDKGRTPLFYAALRNHLDCVVTLVSIDAQWIDVGDARGDTALHAAAISNGVEVLEFLLSCECNPDTSNSFGYTPAHLAKTKDALQVLHTAGATMYCMDSQSRIPLSIAAGDGRDECVQFLCSVTPHEFLLWGDKDGNSCLHAAAMKGHHKAVDVICQWMTTADDFYVKNNKSYTPAHVGSTAAVLKCLYENGADLWVQDPKGRFPLFLAAFHGRVDCVAILLELGMSQPQTETLLQAGDKLGDTALHAACLCGHMQCAILLLYFVRDCKNGKGLRPSELAERAGHHNLAKFVEHVEEQKQAGLSADDIFGCSFESFSAVILYYGSRWIKLYDQTTSSIYYFDRATSASQWERPDGYDEPLKDEMMADKVRDILIKFYTQYCPENLHSLDETIMTYKKNYNHLFLQLAENYTVEDLSLFSTVLNDDITIDKPK